MIPADTAPGPYRIHHRIGFQVCDVIHGAAIRSEPFEVLAP